MKNFMKKITGILTFLSGVAGFILAFYDRFFEQPGYYQNYPRVSLLIFLAMLLGASIIFYAISTLRESSRSEEAKLNRKANLLKKQVEVQKLEKELNELKEASNTN